LTLGKDYVDKIQDDSKYKELLNDVDFQNRTVLKIITSCRLEPLLSESDPKSENIMNDLFVGNGALMCDGGFSGYSNLYHILENAPD
jgi:hypothetical protein